MSRFFRPEQIDTLAQIRCNVCGGVWDRDTSTAGPEMMHLRADWGYHSQHDLQVWTGDVCESCVVRYLAPLIKFDKVEGEAFTTLDDLSIARRLGRTASPD